MKVSAYNREEDDLLLEKMKESERQHHERIEVEFNRTGNLTFNLPTAGKKGTLQQTPAKLHLLGRSISNQTKNPQRQSERIPECQSLTEPERAEISCKLHTILPPSQLACALNLSHVPPYSGSQAYHMTIASAKHDKEASR